MYQENELKKLYERLKAQYPQYQLELSGRLSDSESAILQGRGKPIWRKAICKRKSV